MFTLKVAINASLFNASVSHQFIALATAKMTHIKCKWIRHKWLQNYVIVELQSMIRVLEEKNPKNRGQKQRCKTKIKRKQANKSKEVSERTNKQNLKRKHERKKSKLCMLPILNSVLLHLPSFCVH